MLFCIGKMDFSSTPCSNWSLLDTTVGKCEHEHLTGTPTDCNGSEICYINHHSLSSGK